MSKEKELEDKLNEYAAFIASKVSWSSNVGVSRFECQKPSGIDYVYFIIAPLPNQIIDKHLSNNGKEINSSVLKDLALFSSWGFNGIYVYEPRREEVYVYESPILSDNCYSADYLISEIDKTMHLRLQSGFNPSAHNIGNSFQSPTQQVNPHSPGAATAYECDCGARSIGYRKEDDFAHSRWCKVFRS